MIELYKKYRPRRFKDVIGQEQAIRVLIGFSKAKKFPHCMLFSGPSGCGKTTLCRIVRQKLNCSDADFAEVNCADFRGIDMVRDIRQRMNLAPMDGDCRVWLIDECHKLTNDAQNGLLKLLEDTPSHVYFMLATTEPNKLLNTIKTRATEIVVRQVSNDDLAELLNTITSKEGAEPLSDHTIETILEASDGSPRKALVLLNQVIELPDKNRAEVILKSDTTREAIELARLLCKKGVKWPEVSALLRKIEGEPEEIRWLVLSYFNAILLKGGFLADRAFLVIQAFRDNFYDCKKAGLTAACYEVVVSK